MFILKYYIHSTWDDIVYGAFFLVIIGTTVSIKMGFWITVRMDLKNRQLSTLWEQVVADVVHYLIGVTAIDICW